MRTLTLTLTLTRLGDGECDLRCNVAACEWDGGDCHRPACVFEPSNGSC